MNERKQALEEQIERGILHSEKLRQTIMTIGVGGGAPLILGVLQLDPSRFGPTSPEVFQRVQWMR